MLLVRYVRPAVMSAALAMLFCSTVGPVRAQTTLDKVKAGVSSLISDVRALDNAAAAKLDDNTLGEFDKLIFEFSRVRGIKEGKSQDLEMIGLPERLLLKTTFAEFSAVWPLDVISGIRDARRYFDTLLGKRDILGRFRDNLKSIKDDLVAAKESADPGVVGEIETLARAVVTSKAVPARKQAEIARDQLIALLGDPEDSAVLLSDAELVASLAALRSKLLPFTTGAQKRVHVVAAFYGDLHAIDATVSARRPIRTLRQDRWCVASAALLSACERSSSCKLSFDFSKDLCGYDPAPLMSKEFKGLEVYYRCLTNLDDALWQSVAGEANQLPLYDNLPGARKTTLYSSQQSFACAAPPEATP